MITTADLLKRQGEWPSHLQPFAPAALPPEAFSYRRYMALYGIGKKDARRIVRAFQREKVFKNDKYQVNVQITDATPDFVHLSIKLLTKEPIHDWRDLQAIKNMIVGPDHEALELYPSDERLVDTANQYHLWVLRHPKALLPVGFRERLVIDHGQGAEDGSVQRPIPQPHIEEKPMDPSIRPRTRDDIRACVTRIILAIASLHPDTTIAPSCGLGAGRMRAPEPNPQGSELGLDAIDHVQILCEVEDQLGITIHDKDMAQLQTVGDLVEYSCRAGLGQEVTA